MTKSTNGKHILRFAFVAVFMWFGVTQLFNPAMFAKLIPEWVTSISGLSAETFTKLNGAAEIVLALCLALEWQVSIVAGLLSLHLLMIVFDLGLSAVGVRDLGLAMSVLALAFLYWDKE